MMRKLVINLGRLIRGKSRRAQYYHNTSCATALATPRSCRNPLHKSLSSCKKEFLLAIILVLPSLFYSSIPLPFHFSRASGNSAGKQKGVSKGSALGQKTFIVKHTRNIDGILFAHKLYYKPLRNNMNLLRRRESESFSGAE